MGELALSLMVVLIAGLLIGGLFIWLSISSRRRRVALEEAARLRGWELTPIEGPLESGYRLNGRSEGCAWWMESLSTASDREAGPGSSEVVKRTVWRCEGLATGDLLFGPLPPGAAQGVASLGQTWGALGGLALRTLLGEAAEWAQRLRPVEIDEPTLKGRWLCLASDERLAEALVDPGRLGIIAALPEELTPLILLHEGALDLRLDHRRIDSPPELDALVALGLALAPAWRSSTPSRG